jgi:addiction module RelE/StbE family toxin
MKVVLSASAKKDLRSIGDYIALDNRTRARSFAVELRDACMSLGKMPNRYPVINQYKGLAVRRRVYGNYLVFYQIMGDVIQVLRVLNSAMDYEKMGFGDKNG